MIPKQLLLTGLIIIGAIACFADLASIWTTLLLFGVGALVILLLGRIWIPRIKLISWEYVKGNYELEVEWMEGFRWNPQKCKGLLQGSYVWFLWLPSCRNASLEVSGQAEVFCERIRQGYCDDLKKKEENSE